MKKHRIQLVQLNNKYGSQVYLPYSAGILKAYVENDPDICKKFVFNEFIFVRENLTTLINKVGKVDILGISCYVWNWTLSLKLAEAIKEQQPDCLIVFGGPQVPNDVEGFFTQYPFIDIAVHGEGEVTFHELLKNYTGGPESLKGLMGTTFYNTKTGETVTGDRRPRITDLETIPSPYLEGTFDDLFDNEEYSWMVTWETNRGCPFKCSFCDWGSAIATKVRKFSDERLLKEIDAFTDKKVDLVFGADANFGIFKRDKEFALRLAKNKTETGYPNQFRVCFTKNTTDRVFELAQIFSNAGMNKGVSISMQSLNDTTLENIQRNNIKMKFFKDLQKKYVAAGLVTYTELILPLPGETYESFVEGIDNLLDSSQHSGIVIYNCSIMPNAEMGSKDYQQKYGLDMVEIPIFQAHSDMKETGDIMEKESVVVATNSMSREKYRQAFKYAWAVQSMHLLGLLQVVSITLRYHFGITYSELYKELIKYGESKPESILGRELQRVDQLLDGVFSGGGFDQYVPQFENVSWPAEEATFLRISEHLEQFYSEVEACLREGFTVLEQNKNILKEVLAYQKMRVVTFNNQKAQELTLSYNIHDFFEEARAGMISALEESEVTLQTCPERVYEDKKKFSREVVWYGRKGGKFFHPVEKKF
tara:strand:- start:20736 stop:22679 length:1944 start_codon:yes stop_codon:yes gene_type:complete